MVLIELDEESNGENNSKSIPKSTATGYDSDGYETASETELNDAVCESENRSDNACSVDNHITCRLSENAGCEVGHDAEEDERLRKSESNEEKFEETIKECTKALELNPTYIKALLRRGEAREKLEQYEESIADMTKILELDQSNDQARRAIIRLKPLADEKREKMKEEMIGKLKEMGNSILGRFGMSVDNFKAVKDPNTGSYSISFQQ